MINPALEPYIRAAKERPGPHPSTISAQERRANYRELAETMRGDLVEVESITDGELVLEGRTLASRLYVPFEDEGHALVLFFHGGSFVAGDLDTHDELCRRLARDTRMRFLSVEYRLAPEHRFPSGINDAVAAFRYVASHLGRFADPEAKLIVMGDSAGATLVAVAAAMTRHETLGIAAQVLIYPTLGPALVTDSAHRFASGYFLDLDHLRYDYGQYLGEWSDPTDPRVSPLLFDDLTGAPPAIVVVAQCDPLRDEGVAYAGLLEHFGVPIELLEAEGMVHGFLRMGGLAPEALEIVDDLARHMQRYVENASA
jgi:acetyl esterase